MFVSIHLASTAVTPYIAVAVRLSTFSHAPKKPLKYHGKKIDKIIMACFRVGNFQRQTTKVK